MARMPQGRLHEEVCPWFWSRGLTRMEKVPVDEHVFAADICTAQETRVSSSLSTADADSDLPSYQP